MKYVLKKSAILVATMVFVSLLAFVGFQIIPGDPTTKLLGIDYTEEAAIALRQELGLNDPLLVRYVRWLTGFVSGNLGISYSYFLPVKEVLKGKLAVTFVLAFMAWVLVIALSIPFGILASKRENGIVSKLLNLCNRIVMATPSFFFSILLSYIFGIVLRLFLPGKFVPFSENFFASLGCMIFPSIAIALPKAAKASKLLQGSITSELQKDYVRTAYSRGNSKTATVYKHVLKNALLPTITYLAMSLADIVAGSVIVEQIFVLPGLGRLLLNSIGNRDYPVAQCIIVIIAFVVIFMNYLADIITQLLDPRVRLG